MSQDSYFIGIEQPSELRRNILESAKHSVAILKSRQQLNSLRDQRHKKVGELREAVDDMHKKMQSLTKILPSHSKRSMPKSLKKVEKRLSKKQEQRDAQKKKEASAGADSSQDDSPLLAVAGVGPARAKKLHKAGIESVEDLAGASANVLAEKTGIVKGMVQNLIDAAKKRAKKAGSTAKTVGSPNRVKSEMDVLESKLADIESKLNNL